MARFVALLASVALVAVAATVTVIMEARPGLPMDRWSP